MRTVPAVIGAALTSAAAALVIYACSDATSPRATSAGDVTARSRFVRIRPDSATIKVGDSLHLIARVHREREPDEDADDSLLQWTSLDTAFAVVTARGVVYGVAPGDARIVASFGLAADTAPVRVVPRDSTPAATVASVSISPAIDTAILGTRVQLVATPRDSSGVVIPGRAVVWSSANPSIATIDSSGLLTAIALGTDTITATIGGRSGSGVMVVIPPPPTPVATVALSPALDTLPVGGKVKLNARTLDSTGAALTGRAVAWTSSNPAVATIDSLGNVAAVGIGNATMTATSEGKSGTAAIVVIAPPPLPVASVAVSPATGTVQVGKTLQLSATTLDSLGKTLTGRSVIWTSASPKIATVSPSGLVTGIAAGADTITATSEGKSSTALITVTVAPPPPIDSITIAPAIDTLLPGKTVQLTATPFDSTGTPLAGRVITWASSNPAAATVSATGLVTGVAVGSATITALSEGKSATAKITVVAPPPVPVASVSVTPNPDTIQAGRTSQLTATMKDSAGNTLSGRSVAWASSNAAVATVSSTGLVTGVAPGNATITATSEGKSGTSAITITAPPPAPVATVGVTPNPDTIQVGKTSQLTATTRDSTGAVLTGRKVTWASSDTTIAAVDTAGKVTGVKAGNATITATSEGKSGTSSIVVVAPPPTPVATVSVTPSTGSIQPGATLQLTATTKDSAGNTLTGRSVAWASSNTGVATVSSTGLVTGMAAGTATITATSEGKSGTASITVTAPQPAPVATVTVTPSSASIAAGATVQLTATTKDSAGNTLTGRSVTWASSNSGVATVSATGLVTGVAGGSATITATSEGKSGTSAITVTPPAAANILVGAGDIADCSVTSDDSTGNLLATIAGTVFTAGDNAYPNGATTDYANCYDPTWGRQKARTRPAPGNHEYNTSGAAPYFAYFGANAGPAGQGYYSYDMGAWHVISLNTGINVNPGDAQVTWLKNDLAASTAPCTIAYWHHPRYSSGTTHGSQPFVQPFWAALYAAGAEIVVNGHEHNYERFAPQDTNGAADPSYGIREFVAGVGGESLYGLGTPIANSEFRDDQQHGVLKLELDNGSYKWWFLTLPNGAVADSGSGTCHGAPGGTQASVSSVTVTLGSSSLQPGQTTQATATMRDSAGNVLSGRSVAWSSSNTSVATVSGSGLVSAVAAGSANIIGTSEGKSGSAPLTVTSPSPAPVASVTVAPSSDSLQQGSTVQLTATTRDSSGNVLTGRSVTWTSSNTSAATVSSSGLVSGVAPGSATIMATSEGKSGTSAITVFTPAVATVGPCLQGSGPSMTISGLQSGTYDNQSIAANTRIDATTAQWVTPQAAVLVEIGSSPNICWHGADVAGQEPPSTPWNTMHSNYGMVALVPNFLLENLQTFDTGDGIAMDEQADSNFVIRDVYVKYARDDCIEDTFQDTGDIENSFFDGCYSGFSGRPYAPGTLDGSNNVFTVRNSLVRMQKMDQGYLYEGVHGGFWKWATTAPKIDLFNVVFYMDTNTVENDVIMPPPDKLRNCSGNVMIWEGPGPFPEPVPSCFTLMTGAAGQQYWDNAVAQWKAAHPQNMPDQAPPIVSMWQPRTTTTLTGVVTLVATAVDDQNMGGVQFLLDGQPIGAQVTTETEPTKWALSWDSHGAVNGTHTLTAVATDAAGHTTTSAGISVTISN